MTGRDGAMRPADPLSRAARALYARITRGEPVGPEDTGPLGELVAWRLVNVDPDRPDRPIALDPQEAGRRRLDEELRELAARAAGMAAIPDVSDELGLHFERAKWRSGSGSEFLAGSDQVTARIAEAVDRAESEVLTALPWGPVCHELLGEITDRDSRALARGVGLRTLFGDGVRDDAAARAWATAMSARGTRFRTLVAPFQRCVVVDRRQAFISDHVVGGDPDQTAWHVRDRAFVAFVAEGFEEAWRRADVWYGDPRRAAPAEGEGQLTERQREILIDTAAGVDQRITARRLGIGLRTLTKELGRLRARWGAPTLAALAYQWALSPERARTPGRTDGPGPAAPPGPTGPGDLPGPDDTTCPADIPGPGDPTGPADLPGPAGAEGTTREGIRD
ncbi:TrmB family transcriptional regulator sugar-binding domain-containing protein [Streptomyces sp. NPDC003090]|uniref:TrmB family transcriptional regulator sugar-binding domain-containing protein n=1 Tax=Streptomyces sp. NPDC003090 TaxID=3154274 RepID=UPI003820897E